MTRKQQLKWWQEARFGLFIHWGLYAIPARGEWVMYNERIPVREYEKLAAQFNPAKFNADEWVRLAQDAGMKYIVITAKHHDGFSLFKTDVSPFNVVDATPFGRDVLKELAEACRRADMKLGFYYSHVREWRDPRAQSFEAQGRPDRWGNYGNFWDYPNENVKNLQQYIDEFDAPQLKELLTNYGDVLTIWFDTPSHISPKQGEQLKKLVHKYQPACLVNSRLSYDIETDYASMGDHEIPAAGSDIPWETATTTAGAWGYHQDAAPDRWDDMLEKLIDIASKGGNLLLNVGPDAAGVVPLPIQKELRKIGAWLEKNGKAVYGTEKSPFPAAPSWGRITRRGKKLYLIVTDPLASVVTLTGLRTPALKCKLLDPARTLLMDQQHDAERDAHTLTIRLTGSAERFRAVQVDLADEPDVTGQLEPDSDGRITLPVTQAELLGEKLRVGPSGVTENWTDPADRLQWQFTIHNAGRYNLSLTLKNGFWKLWDWGHELNIELDRELYGVSLIDDGRSPARYEERAVPVASVWLTPGRHVLTISPETLTSRELAGLTLLKCELAPC